MQSPTAIDPMLPAEKEQPVKGAWIALLLLLAINMFNYIDRQVLAAVEPDVRRAMLPNDLSGRKSQDGLAIGGIHADLHVRRCRCLEF